MSGWPSGPTPSGSRNDRPAASSKTWTTRAKSHREERTAIGRSGSPSSLCIAPTADLQSPKSPTDSSDEAQLLCSRRSVLRLSSTFIGALARATRGRQQLPLACGSQTNKRQTSQHQRAGLGYARLHLNQLQAGEAAEARGGDRTEHLEPPESQAALRRRGLRKWCRSRPARARRCSGVQTATWHPA